MRSVGTASWQRQRNMFPNLRLMLGASFATGLLIAIVGAGLFAFRDPSMRIEVPQISRPMLQQPIVDNPRQSFGLSLTARRNGELQRLLALPSSPVQAYAPEPGTGFPYELGPRDSAAADEPQEAAPALPEPAIAAAPVSEPTATAAPAEAPATSEVAALAEPGQPIAEPAAVAMAVPAQPTTMDDGPPAPAIVSAAATTNDEPSTTASVTLPATEVDLAMLAESQDMPLPRPKPALVPGTALDTGPARQRHVKVTTSRPRRATVRIRRPLPPTPAVQAYQFPFFDLGLNDQYDAEGRRIDTSGIQARAAARTQAELGGTAGSVARPTR